MENKIKEHVRSLFNDICIGCSGDVGRVVGFHDDCRDYYYIVKDLFGKKSYYSCVGSFESLKDKIELYPYIENVFNLNGCPKAEVFEDTAIIEQGATWQSSLSLTKES